MIEKMRFVNIMGPVDELDKTMLDYLYPYEIQIESATKELSTANNISGFDEENPYVDALHSALQFYNSLQAGKSGSVEGKWKTVKKEGRLRGKTQKENDEDAMEIGEAIAFVEELNKVHKSLLSEIEDEKREIKNKNELQNQLAPYLKLDFNFEDLSKFEHIKYRFGRMPRMSFEQLKDRIYMEDMIFIKAGKDADYIYGAYFVPKAYHERIDALFSTVRFEVVEFDTTLRGTPNQINTTLAKEILASREKISRANEKLAIFVEKSSDDIGAAYKVIKKYDSCFNMRKYAARTSDGFFILVGWMTRKDASKLEHALDQEEEIAFIIEDDKSEITTTPPTKLRNYGVFKPFEFFVKMYGLPAYNEIDPTPIVAVTYSFLFGIMFADVGQGIVISILGYLLYKKKGFALGAILSVIGVFSMIFGFLFGSCFGYEFEPLWFAPMEVINPDLGMYQILILAIILGVFLILGSMILQIMNAYKRRDFGAMLFDTNGVAGFVFYFVVIAMLVSVLTKAYTVATWIAVIFLGIPLIMMALKEPLSKLVKGDKSKMHSSLGDYILETFFELFEVMLSYMANTISFVRVGAFVLSHAGMMSVVLMMAEGKTGIAKLLVLIIGNIIVIGFEGLIVGIQVLRLEYYESFSRYYKGDGRAFEPYVK